ncbi:hypothetical protein ILUMI_12002 [Ignelater luminosus]|uniref:3-hydroxyisobutyryl-CoA hydrolase, mitochondrial n=1 Tax=Ignelater luminosus TaxID=2038154 RepID=A0A8K0CXC9_IGNLU|nr:hypothetical protein ILUMI_12002 [Ignelater luminosus]
MSAVRTTLLTSNIYKNLLRMNMLNCSSRAVSSVSSEEDVIFESVKDKGVITLNRPKALNALNFSMVNKLIPKLKQWEKEKSLVIIKGTGEKAFCAGGDVRAVVEAGLRGDRLGHDFFRNEYTLNGLIGTYSKPYIALIDGIVMGGGVGLSVHGHYRVATERTLFAMPETAIGLFPDVGGSYFLPRLGGKLGCYLALTGHRLKGADVLKAGVATHYCQSSKLNDLEKALYECSNEQSINETLRKFSTRDETEFCLAPYIEQINKCFSATTIEGIFEALQKDGSEWAQKTLKTLSKMSPTSLKVTLKELNLGSKLNLQECLQMEYRLAVNCLSNKDFYEGVRALLIDKDQKPAWSPSSLKAVTENIVNGYFNKLPDDQELRHKL